MDEEGERFDGFSVAIFVKSCERKDEFEEAGGRREEFACYIERSLIFL